MAVSALRHAVERAMPVLAPGGIDGEDPEAVRLRPAGCPFRISGWIGGCAAGGSAGLPLRAHGTRQRADFRTRGGASARHGRGVWAGGACAGSLRGTPPLCHRTGRGSGAHADGAERDRRGVFLSARPGGVPGALGNRTGRAGDSLGGTAGGGQGPSSDHPGAAAIGRTGNRRAIVDRGRSLPRGPLRTGTPADPGPRRHGRSRDVPGAYTARTDGGADVGGGRAVPGQFRGGLAERGARGSGVRRTGGGDGGGRRAGYDPFGAVRLRGAGEKRGSFGGRITEGVESPLGPEGDFRLGPLPIVGAGGRRGGGSDAAGSGGICAALTGCFTSTGPTR